VIEPGEISPCLDLYQFVAIEVYEVDGLRAELGVETALDQDKIYVSLMARPLANNDTLHPESEKRFGRRANENGIRVHLDSCDVFDEIRFQ